MILWFLFTWRELVSLNLSLLPMQSSLWKNVDFFSKSLTIPWSWMFNINDDEYTYYFLNCLQHTFFTFMCYNWWRRIKISFFLYLSRMRIHFEIPFMFSEKNCKSELVVRSIYGNIIDEHIGYWMWYCMHLLTELVGLLLLRKIEKEEKCNLVPRIKKSVVI